MSSPRRSTQQELNGILGGALFHSAFSGVITVRWLRLADLLCAYFGFQVVLCFNGILSMQISLSASLLVSCALSLAVFHAHFVPFQFVCFYFMLLFW